MDEVDLAQTEIEHTLRSRVLAAIQGERVLATGTCLNCAEPLAPRQRWCDCWCRDDWVRLSRHVTRLD